MSADVGATVAELVPLLDSEQDAKWKVGDVLVRRIHPNDTQVSFGKGQGNGANGWFATVTRGLAEQGHDISEGTLRARYRTSLAFPVEERRAKIAWVTHRAVAEAGPSSEAPQRMAEFLLAMTNAGKQPSRRNAENWLGVPPLAYFGEPAVLKFLSDHPEVIAKAIASDPAILDAAASALLAHGEDDGDPRHRDPSKPRDYGRVIENAVNGINVALLAAKSGEYELTSRDEALLYFVTRLLGERLAPVGDLADLLPAKLTANLDEIERYANAGGIR